MTEVVKGSPADRSGVTVKSVIVGLNGKVVYYNEVDIQIQERPVTVDFRRVAVAPAAGGGFFAAPAAAPAVAFSSFGGSPSAPSPAPAFGAFGGSPAAPAFGAFGGSPAAPAAAGGGFFYS